MIRTRDPADCCVCCASRRYLLSHTSGSRRAIAGWRVISSSMRETNLISLRPHYSALFSVCHTDVYSCSEDVLVEFQSSATTVPLGRSGIKSAWQCQKTDLKSEPLPWIMPFFYFSLCKSLVSQEKWEIVEMQGWVVVWPLYQIIKNYLVAWRTYEVRIE